jgi:hypothetical protein
MNKRAKKKTSARRAPAKKTAKPAAKKSGAKPAPKAAPKPASDVGRYTPGEISGIGWKPFRYPPE